MFQLVVAFFAIANGAIADQPTQKVGRKELFPSQEACMKFFGTQEGRTEKAMLDKFAASKKTVVKFACVKAPEEDNTI